MKVGELIAELTKLPRDCIVVLSNDPCGSHFHPLRASFGNGVDDVIDLEKNKMGIAKLTPTLEDEGYTQEDVLKDAVPAVILWPIN